MTERETIKRLISSNQIEDAFAALKKALPRENDLITLEFQWNNLRREGMMGIISFSDKTVRTNQIIASMLAFSDMIRESDQSTPQKPADGQGNYTQVSGNGNVVIQGVQSSSLNINIPATPPQNRDATTSSADPAPPANRPKKLFFSYSKHDREYLEQLLSHLAVLRRKGKIAPWSDHLIRPGEEWDNVIREELNEADIILLLVSADFLATDYIWDVEIKTAMDRHAQKTAQVVPVVLRSCSWEDTPFGKLNGLPSKAKPVSSYADRDAAWLEVVKGIERLL